MKIRPSRDRVLAVQHGRAEMSRLRTARGRAASRGLVEKNRPRVSRVRASLGLAPPALALQVRTHHQAPVRQASAAAPPSATLSQPPSAPSQRVPCASSERSRAPASRLDGRPTDWSRPVGSRSTVRWRKRARCAIRRAIPSQSMARRWSWRFAAPPGSCCTSRPA